MIGAFKTQRESVKVYDRTQSPRRPPRFPFSSEPLTSLSEPMQSEPIQRGRTRLSAEEQSKILWEGLCLYCGQARHHLVNCSLKNRVPVNKTVWVSQTLCNNCILRPTVTSELPLWIPELTLALWTGHDPVVSLCLVWLLLM